MNEVALPAALLGLERSAASEPPAAQTVGPAMVLKDINTSSPVNFDSFPGVAVGVGSAVFFAATTSDSGNELWKSDGTAAGTVLVKDIAPGEVASNPEQLTRVGATLYFVATEPGSGKELWKSDGTAAGTVLVKDIAPGPASSNPSWLTEMNGVLYFVANDPVAGAEVWKSDGTATGTAIVKDIAPGGLSSFPASLVSMGSVLFFSAYATDTGNELWKSDGTAAGTVMVKDIYPGFDWSWPHSLARVGTSVFFVANDGAGDQVWKSDGTAAGTVRVSAIVSGAGGANITQLTASGGRLFFTATEDATGTELYTSDGTAGGTRLVKDLAPGTANSDPRSLVDVGGTLYFVANEPSVGSEVWRTDGTAASTVLVRDLEPGPQGSDPRELIAFGGLLYFGASSSFSYDLYRSDGTPAGTVAVRPQADGGPGYPMNLGAGAGRLFFAAYSLFTPTGFELWASDGTAAGTGLVRDIRPGELTSLPQGLTRSGPSIFFSAYDPTSNQGLFKTDGTTAGTVILRNPAPGQESWYPQYLTDAGGTLFFQAQDFTTGPELHKSDGTPSGTVLVQDLQPGSAGSYPDQLVAVNGTVFFRTYDPAVGSELYKSDGTAAGTVLVKDIVPGPDGSGPDEMVAMGGRLFFRAWHPDIGSELWVSDGTAAGTVPLELYPGPTGGAPQYLTVVGSTLFFSAYSETGGQELWRSDGTAAGTFVVKDINPGFAGSSPEALTKVGGRLFFRADDGSGTGSELWRSDGTAAGTVMVKDIWPGDISSAVSGIVDLNGTAYFGAVSPGAGYELWKSDGTAAGTVMVKDLWPGSGSGLSMDRMLALPAEQVVLFTATDGTSGVELWRTDGSAARTVRIQDIAPGARSSNPRDLIRQGSFIVFTADDGTTGREPWVAAIADIADVTPPVITCPTGQVAEATSAAGATVNYPPATATDNATASPVITYSQAAGTVFPLGITMVTATATDRGGNQASCSFAVTVRDTTAPAITCPAAQVVEATSAAGANVSYPAATATDAVTASPAITYSRPSGAVFPFGSTSVTATATDTAGNSASCTFQVTVRDTTAPAVTCPADRTAEATSSAGAVVSYPPATATDAVTASPTIAYSQASGGTFPLGTTTITVTATDGAGNAASCTFRVIVRDTTAPTVTCPADQVVEATGPTGATATYPSATASDAVTASPVLTYSQPSGSAFPLGLTPVVVTARDAAGNAASCTFRVTVRDTTPPSITCPADQVAEANSSSGANVAYPAATASDTVSSATVTYSAESGSLFPLGSMNVIATARDASGNSVSCTFRVTVRDTTAPALTCPANLVVEATSGAGATVSYAPATASDAVTAAPTVVYSHPTGSTFPLGSTTITVTATDTAGNSARCNFSVTVRDTTAPAVTCPGNQVAEATSGSGANVSFAAAMASDAVTTAPSVTYSHVSGSVFPLGSTVVTATATDAAGNSASCTFAVAVRDTTAPSVTCPSDQVAEAMGATGAAVTYPPASARDAVSTPALAYSHASGGTFALGSTAVTVTATDAAGNVGRCTFNVVVRDTAAPSLSCPADQLVEATMPTGAPVIYPAATASDAVSSVTVSYSRSSGEVFALGPTAVTVTATDTSGNRATCVFRVTVRDTVPPQLTCSSTVAEATSASGAPVSLTASATDLVTATPAINYSRASGSVFPLGTTAVTATATDLAGNQKTCTFDVIVQDTTAPAVTCPADVTASTSGKGDTVVVNYPPATANDAVTGSPALSYSQPSGSAFPLGTTPVTVTAEDGAGNRSHCTFNVKVEQASGCGCGATGTDLAAWWAPGVVLAAGLGLRRRKKK